MKRNVKRLVTVLVLGLVGFSAFACDIKINGKWIEDVPCCTSKQQMYQTYKRCDKLSLKDFNKANELRKEITKSYTQLNKCTDEEMKVSIKENIKVLDKELKDLTGLSYKDVFNSLNAKFN